MGTESRLRALEREIPADDHDYGDDGAILIRIVIPPGPGEPPLFGGRPYRRMTEAEAKRLGRIWIPDVDDRGQHAEGLPDAFE